MIEITIQVPDRLANRVTRWLPLILELNMIPFQTQAATVANETIRFLLDNPTPGMFLAYSPSLAAQTRLKRLLALNQADMLGEEENRELDELEQIEHLVRMAKLQAKA